MAKISKSRLSHFDAVATVSQLFASTCGVGLQWKVEVMVHRLFSRWSKVLGRPSGTRFFPVLILKAFCTLWSPAAC